MQENLKIENIISSLKEIADNDPRYKELLDKISNNLHELSYTPKELIWEESNGGVTTSGPIIKDFYYKIWENNSGEYSSFLVCGAGQEFILLSKSIEQAKKSCQEHLQTLYMAMNPNSPTIVHGELIV